MFFKMFKTQVDLNDNKSKFCQTWYCRSPVIESTNLINNVESEISFPNMEPQTIESNSHSEPEVALNETVIYHKSTRSRRERTVIFQNAPEVAVNETHFSERTTSRRERNCPFSERTRSRRERNCPFSERTRSRRERNCHF